MFTPSTCPAVIVRVHLFLSPRHLLPGGAASGSARAFSDAFSDLAMRAKFLALGFGHTLLHRSEARRITVKFIIL